MKNRVLAIDYSVNGTCIFITDIDGSIEYLYFSEYTSDKNNDKCIPVDKTEPTLKRVDRVVEAIETVFKEGGADLLVLESASYSSTNKNDDFKDGYAITRFLSRRYNIPYIQVPPVSLKLFLTGNSKAEKEDMRQAIINELNIDYKEVSVKKWDNLCDSRALHLLGETYLKCNRLPAKKGCLDTADVKYFETLPLHRQQVIAGLYNRQDLVKDIQKKRNKLKKNDTR